MAILKSDNIGFIWLRRRCGRKPTKGRTGMLQGTSIQMGKYITKTCSSRRRRRCCCTRCFLIFLSEQSAITEVSFKYIHSCSLPRAVCTAALFERSHLLPRHIGPDPYCIQHSCRMLFSWALMYQWMSSNCSPTFAWPWLKRQHQRKGIARFTWFATK